MRAAFIALLLASLLATSGCLGFLDESRPPSDQRALDALDRTDMGLADVTSYRARINGSAEMTADDRRAVAALRGEILVNVSARAMNGSARLRDGFHPMAIRQRTYVTDYTAYSECPLTGWARRNLSASRPWFVYTPIGEQLAVLNRTPVYWRGTTPVNGTEAAVIVAYPTEQELQAASGSWILAPQASEEANFKNATLTLWSNTETWRPVKASWVTNWRTNGADVTLATTWHFEAFDAPAVVTRPSIRASEIREHGC